MVSPSSKRKAIAGEGSIWEAACPLTRIWLGQAMRQHIPARKYQRLICRCCASKVPMSFRLCLSRENLWKASTNTVHRGPRWLTRNGLRKAHHRPCSFYNLSSLLAAEFPRHIWSMDPARFSTVVPSFCSSLGEVTDHSSLSSQLVFYIGTTRSVLRMSRLTQADFGSGQPAPWLFRSVYIKSHLQMRGIEASVDDYGGH